MTQLRDIAALAVAGLWGRPAGRPHGACAVALPAPPLKGWGWSTDDVRETNHPAGTAALAFGLKKRRDRGDDQIHPDDVDEVYDLVEDARAGDRAAFGILFDSYHPATYRVALARLGSVQDAEDVVAETFLQAWRSLGSYQWTGAPFGAWIAAIARSKVAQHHRAASRRPAQPMAETVERAPDAGDLTGQDQSELRMEVTRLLATLPEQQRAVLTLRFYGGLSAEEIGQQLGMTAGAVRQVQLRALERLSFRSRMEEAA